MQKQEKPTEKPKSKKDKKQAEDELVLNDIKNDF